jgi:hypothetical protein
VTSPGGPLWSIRNDSVTAAILLTNAYHATAVRLRPLAGLSGMSFDGGRDAPAPARRGYSGLRTYRYMATVTVSGDLVPDTGVCGRCPARHVGVAVVAVRGGFRGVKLSVNGIAPTTARPPYTSLLRATARAVPADVTAWRLPARQLPRGESASLPTVRAMVER